MLSQTMQSYLDYLHVDSLTSRCGEFRILISQIRVLHLLLQNSYLVCLEAEMEMNVVGDLVEDMMDKVTASKGSETVPLKKIKENEDATMEVAEELLGEDNKENIRQVLKAMSRKELEDTTLVQIVEALTKHSEAGKFRSKVIELQLHKDKLQQRITLLQKQVMGHFDTLLPKRFL